MMNLINAVLATEPTLPPICAMYEYVVAGNGLFIRAEDTHMQAMVQISDSRLIGLRKVEPYAKLLIDPIPTVWLTCILESARRHMPNEVLYQFVHDAQPRKWRCVRPTQVVSPISVRFEDEVAAVADLHSHNSMAAFFSSGADDSDEQGLRFYCVIGKLDTDTPEIACRVGVYGHHMAVSVETIFESAGPFVDTFGKDVEPEQRCRSCGCTDLNGCYPERCYWVEPNLCSNCAPKRVLM